ncbi:MAG: rhodanese-like domain-containing protein [Alcanivorax sp.]
MTHNISAKDAHDMLVQGGAVLIDVREPDEFKTRHIPYAHSIPLSTVSEMMGFMDIPQDKKIIMQCLAGKRGEQACGILRSDAKHEIFNIEGGIGAWESSGLPVIGGAEPKFSIFRQVQMIMGTLIAALVVFGFLGMTFMFALAGIFAAALAVAGFTGWCGLAILLRKMPWNKP